MAKLKQQASSKALPITGECMALQEQLNAVSSELDLDHSNLAIMRRFFDAALEFNNCMMKQHKKQWKAA